MSYDFRKLLAVFCVLAVAFVPVGLLEEDDAAGYDVMLYEVNRSGDFEGVSIHNYGSKEIDLRYYFISDNPNLNSSEGYITFDKQLIIPANTTYTIAKNVSESEEFTNRYDAFCDGSHGVTFNGKFTLADGGDDVYLFRSSKIVDKDDKDAMLKNSTVVDVFIYGDSKAKSDMWVGETFKFVSGKYAQRTSFDNRGAGDWVNTRSGMTQNTFDPDQKFDAYVTPFIFPESGGIPIYRALEEANDTVYITMYELTNKNLYGLLYELEQRTGNDHVDVTILLERSPLGYTSLSSDARYMKALVDVGCEIFFIGGDGDRYSYVHAKYCIIDESKVIITSENWTKDNLDGKLKSYPYSAGNRGWGAIVESDEYASFMMSVFTNDCNPELKDVTPFDEVIINTEAIIPTYESPELDYESMRVRTTVTPLMSPDSSFDGTIYYIKQAQNRIFTEQQSLTESYTDYSKRSPIQAMYNAADHMDVRFILCLPNNEGADKIVDEINMTSKIKACTMSAPYLHNKGVICDNTAIVSSVNWTDNSFKNNREMAVAIHCKEIADFFAESFLADFERNYTYSGLDVTFTEISSTYKQPGDITVSVSVSQEGTFEYTWDLDGKKTKTSIPRTVLAVDSGEHKLTVTVTSSSGSTGKAIATFTVGSEKPSILDSIGVYLAPIIAVILGALVAVRKSLSGKRR